ncbi:MAG: YcaQ family DNA glycosylase [Betaproteobacteria bacterium]|nr:YcaQ family DNA glycosylase [Betaproteobacteria bacterium]
MAGRGAARRRGMTPEELKRRAIAHTLFPRTDLIAAIERLGYVQADPIRAPARAQDLILFQRVQGYRAGGLEARYADLPVFEDSIFNYGFFPARVREALLPRALSPHWVAYMQSHAPLRRRVLSYLKVQGEAHPRDIEAALNAGRRVNGWGGTSSAATLMLEGLHREGKVDVVRRDAGIRVYGRAPPRKAAMPATHRASALIRLMVNLYAPCPEGILLTMARSMQRTRPAADFDACYRRMVKRGELVTQRVDRTLYIWPHDGPADHAPHEGVRFLAPFDPLVWDRKRFAHLWGWDYRFEAYTPEAKRKMGYYALPLLWREDVVGWVNARVEGRRVIAQPGYVQPVARAEKAAFKRAFDEELERFAAFLLPEQAGTKL